MNGLDSVEVAHCARVELREDRESGVTVVTGGASGIGGAVLEAIASTGHPVVCLDRDAAALAAARTRHGGSANVHFRQLDIVVEAELDAAIEWIESELGDITGLVNSAGIGRDIPCLETSVEDFRRIVEVNLVGSFAVTRKVAARMARRGKGAIANLASVSGILGNFGRVAYGASKGGVITMTKAFALELAGRGIRVNAVAPGPIETPLVAAMHTPAYREKWLSAVPQKRYGQPEEVAEAVLFLLDSRRSGFIAGQTLCVDGGFVTSGIPGED